MPIQLILFLFFGSLFGMVVLFIKKIPVLVELKEVQIESFFEKVKKKIKKNLSQIKYFQVEFWENLSKKLIKKIRILSLKVDNFTFHLLRKIGKKKKESLEKDDYFEKIKRA